MITLAIDTKISTPRSDLTGARSDLTGGVVDRARPALTRQQKQWELPVFSDNDNDNDNNHDDNDDDDRDKDLFSHKSAEAHTFFSQSNRRQSTQVGAGALFFLSFIVIPVLLGGVALLFL